LRHTHLLGALAPSGPVLIADPHGRGAEALEAAFAQIDVALAAV
jgi:hypothetical protein